jgi:hypothetical protein
LERYLADPNAETVFRKTVAKQINRLDLLDVQIINATAVRPSTLTIWATYVTEHPLLPQRQRTVSGLEDEEPLALLMRYKLVFIAQRVVVSNSNTRTAYQIAATQLTQSVSDGTFTATLQNKAVIEDAPAFLEATTEVAKLAIDTNFTTIVTHSAIPTSQPSSQPSGLPSSQPTSFPSVQPTAVPSTQPSLQPTGRPTSAPTLTMETKWRNAFNSIVRNVAWSSYPYRTSYYAMDVSGESLYGSCESWNAYWSDSLRTTRHAKAINKLELIVQTAESYARPTVYTCDDPESVIGIVDKLVSAPKMSLQGNLTRTSITCGGEEWVVEDCKTGASAEYSLSGAEGETFSRALCVGCTSPCAEYNCTSHYGSTVLSPCTHEKSSCPYLKGSLQIFSGYFQSTDGTGPASVFVWYGTVWGMMIIFVFSYNRAILKNRDWSFIRGLPDATFSRRAVHRKKIAGAKTESSKSSALTLSRGVSPREKERSQDLNSAALEMYETIRASRAIADNVAELLDRIMIAAGKHKLLHGQIRFPLMQTFWYRMLNYNHYLAPFSRFKQKERFAHGLNILTRASCLFFAVALCFYYNYPEDDNSCYSNATEKECTDRVVPFDENQEYCSWVGLTGPDSVRYDGNQPQLQTQCLWMLPTGSLVVVQNVILVAIAAASIPRAFFANFLLECIILAPDRVVKVHPEKVPPVANLSSKDGASSKELRPSRSSKIPPESSRQSQSRDAESGASGKSTRLTTSNSANLPSKEMVSEKDPREREALTSGQSERLGRNKYGKFDPRNPRTPRVLRDAESKFYRVSVKESSAKQVTPKQDFQQDGQPVSTELDPGVLFQSFALHFTQYRDSLSGDLHDAEEFRRAWVAGNLFLYNCKGTLKELRADVLRKSFAPGYGEKVTIMEELYRVRKCAENAAPQYEELLQSDEQMFSVRLMVAFLLDLLGRDSIQCRFVKLMLDNLLNENAPYSNVRNRTKLLAVLLILLVNVGLVYGSVLLLQRFAARRQWYWVITAALAILVDMVVVEGVEALWFQWALPLCVVDALSALRHTFSEVANQFQRSVKSGADPHGTQPTRLNEQLYTSERLSLPRNPSVKMTMEAVSVGVPSAFSMPASQFVSNSIAQKFPRHIASRLVLSYRTAFPRTITTLRWPATFTDWTSGLHFESLGYVSLGYAAMWTGVCCPVFIQQMLISGLTSSAIWLLSKVARRAMRGDLFGVYVLAVVIGVLFLCAKSFGLSWNRDAAKFAAGVQSLFPDEDELRIRREQDSAPPSPLKVLQIRMEQGLVHTSHALQGMLSTSDPHASPAPLSPLNTPRGSGLGPITVVNRRVTPLRATGLSKKSSVARHQLVRANAVFGMDVKEITASKRGATAERSRGVFDLSSSSSEGSMARAPSLKVTRAPASMRIPAVARAAVAARFLQHASPRSAEISVVAVRSPTASGRALYDDLSDSGDSHDGKHPPVLALPRRPAVRQAAPTPQPALRVEAPSEQDSSDSDSLSPAARLRALYDVSSSSDDSSDSD